MQMSVLIIHIISEDNKKRIIKRIVWLFYIYITCLNMYSCSSVILRVAFQLMLLK